MIFTWCEDRDSLSRTLSAPIILARAGAGAKSSVFGSEDTAMAVVFARC
jgi:hypothetical protein